jgi:hypothetical protein
MTAVANTDEAHLELAHSGEPLEVPSGRHQALKAFHLPLRPRGLACPKYRREHHAQLDQITSKYTASH